MRAIWMGMCASVGILALITQSFTVEAVVERLPTATLIAAPTLTLPGAADSNSPVVWDWLRGQPAMFLFTSFNGWSNRAVGDGLGGLRNLGPVAFTTPPPHGVWFEAVIADDAGTWYGYYHNERPAEICGDTTRMLPRIGAARSSDFGATWEDLGTILEAPPDSHECDSRNRFFVGGVGDFSVVLDQDDKDLYFFFSQYVDDEATQGVAVARLPWAYRDRPRGRMTVWSRGTTWLPPRRTRAMREPMTPPDFIYSAGVPIFRVRDGWHDGTTVDAFWGPSVHWNTHLEHYVMLLNHATDIAWRQEGIYVSFAQTLTDPTGWSAPQRLIGGGDWYPQVIGIEPGVGSDRLAGERARFFVAGRSRYIIQFAR